MGHSARAQQIDIEGENERAARESERDDDSGRRVSIKFITF